jgi:hypothetical protein
MHKRKRRAPGKDGKGGEQWAPLSYAMAHHPAFRALSGPAMKVWWELRCRYNGGNNGRLHLSMSEAAKLLGLSKTTVARAFAELEAAGFIVKTREGQWYGRIAHEWRCTDIPMNGAAATRDWQAQRPPKTERGTDAAPSGGVTVPP